MNQDNLTDETLPDAETNVAAAGGETAVAPDTMTLAEMNQFLGKEFKDKDTAMKAIKDTFAFVGRKPAEAAPATDTSEVESKVQQLADELFYTQNPQFKDMRGIIAKMGGNPAEVVGTDEFKKLFEKVKVADEAISQKSVVHASPRLAETKSDLDQAVTIANSRASGQDLAEHLASSIIKDATQG